MGPAAEDPAPLAARHDLGSTCGSSCSPCGRLSCCLGQLPRVLLPLLFVKAFVPWKGLC